MTCFWDGIMSALNTDDFKGMCKSSFANQKEFVTWIKEHNELTNSVKWNGTPLKDKEYEDNYIHIDNFDPTSIYNGYDCSTSEPFLYLVASLFRVNIIHDYNGILINYTVPTPTRTLRFKSDTRHFWKL